VRSKQFLLVLPAALSLLWLSARPLSAETVTLPVAASVTGVGGVPFVSDVRVFNTSYTDVLTVTAVYRFNGATRVFQLAAREAKAFDDIGVSLFGAPGSVGAVEFTSSGGAGSLVVSSQLRSPVAGGGFVGMFIPGLPSSAAREVTVLTGLVNGDSRTNIGAYNPNEKAVTATIRLYDGSVLLGTKSVGLEAHAGTQLNNIYGQVGFESLVRSNGYATVESSDAGSPLFTYAAEADNKSGDLILIVGAQDVVAPLGFNAPTATATSPPGGSSPTPTPTPVQSGTTVIVNVGQSGTTFSPSTAVIHVGDTVEWDFKDSSGFHSTTSGTCTTDPYYGGSNCSPLPSGLNWDSGTMGVGQKFSQRFTTAGSYRYYCSVHGSMMTGIVQVNP
jgi:plastocyanin